MKNQDPQSQEALVLGTQVMLNGNAKLMNNYVDQGVIE
jgi:hypothetical protein